MKDAGHRISIHRTNSCRGRSCGGESKEGVSGPIGPGLCGILHANFGELPFPVLGCITLFCGDAQRNYPKKISKKAFAIHAHKPHKTAPTIKPIKKNTSGGSV